jgi:HEAT repeat protein
VNYRSQAQERIASLAIAPISIKGTDAIDRLVLPQLEKWLQAFLAGDFQARWELGKQVEPLGHHLVWPLLHWLQHDETDWEVRWFAIRLLSGFNTAGVIGALATFMVTTDDSDLQATAAQALIDMGERAIAPMIELLHRPEQRKIAVQALAHIRQRPVIEPLLGVIQDSDPHIRYLAIEALGSFHDERVTPALLQALQDPSSAVRTEAAHALGRRRDLRETHQLIAHLEPILWDINPTVCCAVATAIGRLGGAGSEAALYRVLRSAHTPETLQQTAARALSWIDTPQAIEHLCAALASAPLSVRCEIVQALGQTQTPERQAQAIDTLMQWSQLPSLDDQDSRFKQALALALGNLQVIAALPVLNHLCCDRDPTVSCHALAALKKIAP